MKLLFNISASVCPHKAQALQNEVHEYIEQIEQ